MSNYQLYDLKPPSLNATEEIIAGLSANPKRIHPKFFYDSYGSKLFDTITELPEYYLKRAELSILNTHRNEIAEAVGENVNLIEFGSGSSEKIRSLLELIRPQLYIPIDISKEHLDQSSRMLADTYAWLEVKALCADYNLLTSLPWLLEQNKTVGFFPGSSIGNCTANEAISFLTRIHSMIGRGGGLLVGVDCTQSADLLHPAYNDKAGTTAAFNLNALSHINRITGASFSLDTFQHQAIYNEKAQRIEMYLRSIKAQEVGINGHIVSFQAGEMINTEHSHKWSRETFLAMVASAGFRAAHDWADDKTDFSVFYLNT